MSAAYASLRPGALSLPSSFAATQVHHGYRRAALAEITEPFGFVLDAFAPVKDAWLSYIDSDGFIVLHRDRGPYYERWQVVVFAAGYMTLDGVEFESPPGSVFPVAHWLPHSVRNPTNHPRVHLVIDRDVVTNPEPFAFETYEEI